MLNRVCFSAWAGYLSGFSWPWNMGNQRQVMALNIKEIIVHAIFETMVVPSRVSLTPMFVFLGISVKTHQVTIFQWLNNPWNHNVQRMFNGLCPYIAVFLMCVAWTKSEIASSKKQWSVDKTVETMMVISWILGYLICRPRPKRLSEHFQTPKNQVRHVEVQHRPSHFLR